MCLKLRLRVALAAMFAFVAFAGAAPATAASDLTSEELGLARAVNSLRKARGLAPLTLRLDLSQAARAYARRMAEERFFSHVGPDGAGMVDRVEAVGYNWRRLGETLAAGQETPEATAKAWRDSAGHAKIIFDPQHRHLGVGYWRRPSPDPQKPELERYWVLLAGDVR